LREGVQRERDDLKQRAVTEGAGDFAMLRERARVRRGVHLRDELRKELQPDEEAGGRRV
jgi:hypothetical protein